MKNIAKSVISVLISIIISIEISFGTSVLPATALTFDNDVANAANISIWMPDSSLQKTIFTALHDLGQSVNANGGYYTTTVNEITPKMLADIRYLNVDTKDIKNLSGLQYATNLIQADFSGNNITTVPNEIPGGTNLHSLDIGNYPLTTASPSWVLSPNVRFQNSTENYTNINQGFDNHSIVGTYTLSDNIIQYNDDKTTAIIPFTSFFKGIERADGSYINITPNINIKYSSSSSLIPKINTNKKQIELPLNDIAATTMLQLQFIVNARSSNASYTTFDTLSFRVPETNSVINDPMTAIPPSEISNISHLSANNANIITDKVNALENFMKLTMMTDTGIYSGYMTNTQKNDVKTSPEMFNEITESSGLYLEFLALQGNSTVFDNYYYQIKKTFYHDGSFYWMYNTRTKKLQQGNASLDDLRIMRALTIMQAKAPSDTRRSEISRLVTGFKKYSTINDKMIDGTNFANGSKEPAIRLCYLDMQELRYIYGEGEWSKSDYNQQLKTLENGYLGDNFPWYKTYYYYGDMNGYKRGQYSNLPEAEQEVNAIDSLLVILHLAQIGRAKPASISWIKSHVHNRTLYNNYYTDGTPVEKNSAASSYAIAALIASTVNDKDMYNDAIHDLNDSQVPAGYGDFSGCLGDIPSLTSATYNNLTGLLAYYY